MPLNNSQINRLANQYHHLAGQVANQIYKANPFVDRDELCSYLYEKLVDVLKKIDENQNPRSFVITSLRLHSLNFIRDTSTMKIPRAFTNTYLTWRKLNNSRPNFESLTIEQQAKEIGVGKAHLRDTMQSMRMRFTTDLDSAWNVSSPQDEDDTQLDALNQLGKEDKAFLMEWAEKGRPESDRANELIVKVRNIHSNLLP